MSTLTLERSHTKSTPPHLMTSGSSASGTHSILWEPIAREVVLWWPDYYPNQHLLSRIDDPRYVLRQHILLNIESIPSGAILASEPTLNMYGVGETIAEAVDDFSSMLVDLYEELEESRKALSYHLRRQLDRLTAILAPRQPPWSVH